MATAEAGSPDDASIDADQAELTWRLRECEDHQDILVAVAIHVAPRLWPYLCHNADCIFLVVQDIARQYRRHRERTRLHRPMDIARYVERYVDQVETELAELSDSPALLWDEYLARLEPEFTVIVSTPSGISRRLRCFDDCCIDDPHAEMRLLVGGEEIGGTWFDPDQQWISWGPAGESTHHPTRSAAEAVQLDAHRAGQASTVPGSRPITPDTPT
jgi:hypothetical protein